MSILELENVSVKYNTAPVVENVMLNIYKDDFIGIIGPNGGGKTSLVKAIMGLVPYTGKIQFSKELAEPGSIGYLPQQNNFDKSFPISVHEVILTGLQPGKANIRRKLNIEKRNTAQALSNTAGINHLLDKPIGEISGGEMQRTLLFPPLISDPSLLILH